jgi:hypothetical protein
MDDQSKPALAEVGHVVAGPDRGPQRLPVRLGKPDRALAAERLTQLVEAAEGRDEDERTGRLARRPLTAGASPRPVR